MTVATYPIVTHRDRADAEFTHLKLFDEQDWGLIIYDEVHLLPAPVFQVTAGHLRALGHEVEVVGPDRFPLTLPAPGYPEVRLAVAPPVRKKRRRTRPTTSTSVPVPSLLAAAGGSNQQTGTDSARPGPAPSAGRTVTSKASRASPDGNDRSSGSRLSVPRSTTTLVPAGGTAAGRGTGLLSGRVRTGTGPPLGRTGTGRWRCGGEAASNATRGV